MSLPIARIKFVSLEQPIAVPLASRHLTDWGARVIKIERPGSGDFCRDYDRVMNGLSGQFVWTNRSKESRVLDSKSEQGLNLLETLLRSADVFIQSLAPSAVRRTGSGCAFAGCAFSPPHCMRRIGLRQWWTVQREKGV